MAVLRVLLTLGLVPRLRDVFVREWAYNDSAQVCPNCPKWFGVAPSVSDGKGSECLSQSESAATEHSVQGCPNCPKWAVEAGAGQYADEVQGCPKCPKWGWIIEN